MPLHQAASKYDTTYLTLAYLSKRGLGLVLRRERPLPFGTPLQILLMLMLMLMVKGTVSLLAYHFYLTHVYYVSI